jgi:hypothetical protein
VQGQQEPGGSGVVREPPPADEVADLAQDRGISRSEAQERLTWQASIPDLTDQAEAALGDAFGGVWVDPEDGDRLKVGVVGKGRPAVQDRAATAVEASGLAAAADVVPVEHSYASLVFASSWLSERVVRISRTSEIALGSGLRPDDNAVVLHLPKDGRSSPAIDALVAEARSVLGTKLEIAHDATRGQAQSCVYPYCDPPLRAGIRMDNSIGGPPCTAGFLARSRTDNVLYQLTAGHCHSEVPAGTWRTRFSNRSGPHEIGPVHNTTWSANGDVAIIRVVNPAGWAARAWVFVTDSVWTARDESYSIADDRANALHQRICTTGAVYGLSNCGEVEELDATFTYCIMGGTACRTVQHLARASYCAVPGDSGAPMYANHVAFGIHVARTATCMSYYQGIQGAEDLMNVNVAHDA